MKNLFLVLALIFVSVNVNAEAFLPKTPEILPACPIIEPNYCPIVAAAYAYTCYAKSRSGVVGEGYSTSIEKARQLAIADCRSKSGGQSCRITRCF